MDEKQLSDFLADLSTELKARSRLKVKAIQENKRLPGSKTRIQLTAGSFKTTIQLDPVATALLRLNELLCEKFAVTEGDRQHLWRALIDSFVLGRKREILENESEHRRRVTKAINGRRLIGATSRAKVAKAAETHMHLSKERAAVAMADVVNLDPGTIRRYLSELFPGDEWKH